MLASYMKVFLKTTYPDYWEDTQASLLQSNLSGLFLVYHLPPQTEAAGVLDPLQGDAFQHQGNSTESPVLGRTPSSECSEGSWAVRAEEVHECLWTVAVDSCLEKEKNTEGSEPEDMLPMAVGWSMTFFHCKSP